MITAPRFVVSINGQQRCVAGFEGYAVLTAGIHFTRSPDGHRSPLRDGVAHMRVGGLQGRDHVDWLTDDLFVGDEVSIRVLDGGPFDPPSVRERPVPGTCAATRPQQEAIRRQLDARRERLAKVGDVIPHRFEVLGNGERLCMAGLEFGVLSMRLTWVRRDPAAQPPHSSESADELEGGDVDLRVGGLKDDVHLDWCNVCVDVGDEVVVRILGPGPADPPQSRYDRLRIPHEEGTVVSSARATLRKIVEDDLPFVSELLEDAQAVAHFQSPLNGEESKQWLAQHCKYPQHHRGMWVIIDNSSLKPVGLAGVIDIDIEGKILPVVQCIIDPSHRRRQHGIDSVWTCFLMLHEWASHPLDAYALVQPENEAALALAHKLKMKRVRTVQHKENEHILFVAKHHGARGQ